MTSEKQVCSSSWIILLRDYPKWRSTRHQQIDHYAVYNIVPQWSDKQIRQYERWSSTRSWRSNQRHAGTLYGYLWKISRNKIKNESRARKEASSQEVRGYHKQFAEAKHLEYKSWVDNEVFDLIDMRRLSRDIMWQDDGCSPSRWLLKSFQDKLKEHQQTDSPASTRPGFRMSCEMATSQSWNIFTLIPRQRSFNG